MGTKTIAQVSIYLLFLFSFYWIGNQVIREDTFFLFLCYIGTFLCYLLLILLQTPFKSLFVLGVLARVLFFISLPSLSDDVYRFIWDGTLLTHGIHPFENIPHHYVNKNLEGITYQLYEKLNSTNYFTIYPPLNQLFFWLAASLGNGNWLLTSNIIRFVLMVSELGTCYYFLKLLKHYDKPRNLLFWYFLNPLIIIELVGNVHFEALVIFFMLAATYYFEKNKKKIAAINFGLAIATKLLPFIYLPAILIKGIIQRKWVVSLSAFVIGIACLLPIFITGYLKSIQSSIELYFLKFEFNASLYFIAREIGYEMVGYNAVADIGPLLSKISLLTILLISIFAINKTWMLPKVFLAVLTCYLAFTTTVHPWYITPLIAFGTLSGIYFPIVWSFTIFVTYLGYSHSGYHLPMTYVIGEYLLVILFVLAAYFWKPKKIVVSRMFFKYS